MVLENWKYALPNKFARNVLKIFIHIQVFLGNFIKEVMMSINEFDLHPQRNAMNIYGLDQTANIRIFILFLYVLR